MSATTVRIFGVPVSGLSLFPSILISLACGFIAFFGTTFLGILAGLIVLMAGHTFTAFDVTYKIYGLTAGLIVFAVVFSYLMTLWVRDKVSGR